MRRWTWSPAVPATSARCSRRAAPAGTVRPRSRLADPRQRSVAARRLGDARTSSSCAATSATPTPGGGRSRASTRSCTWPPIVGDPPCARSPSWRGRSTSSATHALLADAQARRRRAVRLRLDLQQLRQDGRRGRPRDRGVRAAARSRSTPRRRSRPSSRCSPSSRNGLAATCLRFATVYGDVAADALRPDGERVHPRRLARHASSSSSASSSGGPYVHVRDAARAIVHRARGSGRATSRARSSTSATRTRTTASWTSSSCSASAFPTPTSSSSTRTRIRATTASASRRCSERLGFEVEAHRSPTGSTR